MVSSNERSSCRNLNINTNISLSVTKEVSGEVYHLGPEDKSMSLSGTRLKSLQMSNCPCCTALIFFKVVLRNCICLRFGAYKLTMVYTTLSMVHTIMINLPSGSSVQDCSWKDIESLIAIRTPLCFQEKDAL